MQLPQAILQIPEPRKNKRFNKADIMTISLNYTILCIQYGIDAEEFTSKFLHIHDQIDTTYKRKGDIYAIETRLL